MAADFAHLKGLENLAVVNRSETAITNEGLKFLLPGKNLQTLQLDGSKVTADEIEVLQHQYPGLNLER